MTYTERAGHDGASRTRSRSQIGNHGTGGTIPQIACSGQQQCQCRAKNESGWVGYTPALKQRAHSKHTRPQSDTQERAGQYQSSLGGSTPS
jgi:hypothetical protein